MFSTVKPNSPLLQKPPENLINEMLLYEIFTLIFTQLSPKGVLTAERVCKLWEFLAKDEQIWRFYCQRLGFHSKPLNALYKFFSA